MSLSRFRVLDNSMLPSFREGDFVLTRPFIRLGKGDVVVFKFERKNYLKRVSKVEGELVYVKGDSLQSVRLPPIRKKDIIGKVWTHARRS